MACSMNRTDRVQKGRNGYSVLENGSVGTMSMAKEAEKTKVEESKTEEAAEVSSREKHDRIFCV